MTRNVVSNPEDNLTLSIPTQFKKDEFVAEALQADIITDDAKEAEKYRAPSSGNPALSKYSAPLPANEIERLEALRLYDIHSENEDLLILLCQINPNW